MFNIARALRPGRCPLPASAACRPQCRLLPKPQARPATTRPPVTLQQMRHRRFRRDRATRCLAGSQGELGPGPASLSDNEVQLAELRSMGSAEALRQAALTRPELTATAFLFWLLDKERASPRGKEREQLSAIAVELVAAKEELDYQAASRLLPTFASSLAYVNYRRWQEESGQQVPEVAPGVGVEELYRMTEQQEEELQAARNEEAREALRRQWQRQQQGDAAGSSSSSSWQPSPLYSSGSRRSSQSNTTSGLPAYQQSMYSDLAAAAIARARSRLMGYDDSQAAAEKLLDILLHSTASREERSTLFPDAFRPPGLLLPGSASAAPAVDARGTTSFGAAMQPRRQSSGKPPATPEAAPAPAYVCTTPDALLQAVAARLSSVVGQAAAGAAAGPTSTLASGEQLQEVLLSLQEDVQEYNEHVYSRLSPLDKISGGGGQW